VKVYGPYKRKDGRMHVVHYDGTTRRTQSYPRYLVEKELGVTLETWEEVDHINNDYTDNRLENLQIISGTANRQKAMIGREAKLYTFNCPECDKEATITYRQYKWNQLTQGKTGPYCSKSCAGKVHK
jgi:hypothetical protein